MKMDDHLKYKKRKKDPFGRPGGKHGGVPKKGSGYDKAYQANMKKIKELEQKEEVGLRRSRFTCNSILRQEEKRLAAQRKREEALPHLEEILVTTIHCLINNKSKKRC